MIVLGCSWAPWDWGDCVADKLGEAAQWAFGSLFSVLLDAVKRLVVKAVEAGMKGVAPERRNTASRAGAALLVQWKTR